MRQVEEKETDGWTEHGGGPRKHGGGARVSRYYPVRGGPPFVQTKHAVAPESRLLTQGQPLPVHDVPPHDGRCHGELVLGQLLWA